MRESRAKRRSPRWRCLASGVLIRRRWALARRSLSRPDEIAYYLGYAPLDVGVDALVRVAGARVQDWEDVAAGPCPGGNCLYVADIGDNRRVRDSVEVLRVPVGPGGSVSAPQRKAACTRSVTVIVAVLLLGSPWPVTRSVTVYVPFCS